MSECKCDDLYYSISDGLPSFEIYTCKKCGFKYLFHHVGFHENGSIYVKDKDKAFADMREMRVRYEQLQTKVGGLRGDDEVRT